jgi:hypothetical protein
MTDATTPTYERNMRIIGHTDIGGEGADGMQIILRHQAFVRYFSSPRFSASAQPVRPTCRRGARTGADMLLRLTARLLEVTQHR